MKMSIKELQQIETDILKCVVKICEDNGITYYMQAGSVLGAVRHKGPIPWDYDVDIIVPSSEIDRFVEIVSKELPDKYYVDYYTINSKSLREFPRIGLKRFSTKGLHLDVFILMGLPDDREKQLSLIEESFNYRINNRLLRLPLWRNLVKLRFSSLKLSLFDRTYYSRKFTELCKRYPYNEAHYVMNPSGKYREKNIFKKEIYGIGKKTIYCDFEVTIPSETDYYLKQYYGDYMIIPPSDIIETELNKTYIIE